MDDSRASWGSKYRFKGKVVKSRLYAKAKAKRYSKQREQGETIDVTRMGDTRIRTIKITNAKRKNKYISVTKADFNDASKVYTPNSSGIDTSTAVSGTIDRRDVIRDMELDQLHHSRVMPNDMGTIYGVGYYRDYRMQQYIFYSTKYDHIQHRLSTYGTTMDGLKRVVLQIREEERSYEQSWEYRSKHTQKLELGRVLDTERINNSIPNYDITPLKLDYVSA